MSQVPTYPGPSQGKLHPKSSLSGINLEPNASKGRFTKINVHAHKKNQSCVIMSMMLSKLTLVLAAKYCAGIDPRLFNAVHENSNSIFLNNRA
jgi:hypothetical protein